MSLPNVTFIKSAPNKEQWINDELKEFVILGRSNVGKSTFINRLSNQNRLARTSSTPGRTRLLNFFDVNGKFRIVDAPGYGYAKTANTEKILFQKMMNEYFEKRENLIGAVLLLDARRIPTDDDVMMFNYLTVNNIPFILVATKYDKLNQSGRALLKRRIMETLGLDLNTKLIVSAFKQEKWIEEVKTAFSGLLGEEI